MPPSTAKRSRSPPLRTWLALQSKRRRLVMRPPLGMNRSQGVAVRVQGAWLWFSMVYCTATVFCP